MVWWQAEQMEQNLTNRAHQVGDFRGWPGGATDHPNTPIGASAGGSRTVLKRDSFLCVWVCCVCGCAFFFFSEI